MIFGSPPIVTNGLVLNLDAGNIKSYPRSGTVWNDMSGNGNNATLTNGPTFNSNNGGVLVFDGTNDYAIINNSATLNRGSGSYSGEVWIAIPSTAATERMIFEYNIWPNNGTYQLTTQNGTQIVLNFPASNAASKFLSYTYSPLVTNIWTNIVGQFDTVNNLFNLYINGALATQVTDVTQEIGNVTSNLYIMSRGGTSLHLPARLGLLRIYNRALSAQEVQQNYNALKSRFNL